MYSNNLTASSHSTTKHYEGGRDAAFRRELIAQKTKQHNISNAFRTAFIKEAEERKKTGEDLADKTAIEIASKVISKNTEKPAMEHQKSLGNILHARLAIIMSGHAEEATDDSATTGNENFNSGKWEIDHEVLSQELGRLDFSIPINLNAEDDLGRSMNQIDILKSLRK